MYYIVEYYIGKMMRSIMYGANSNNLEKYCQYQNCQKQVIYNKLNTSSNNVSITRRMKYSRYVKTAFAVGGTGMCTKFLQEDGEFS